MYFNPEKWGIHLLGRHRGRSTEKGISEYFGWEDSRRHFRKARISWSLSVQITGLQPCRWWTRPCPWRRRWRAGIEVNAWNEDTTTMRGSWKQERRQLGHPKHDTCLDIQPHSCLPHLMEAGQTEDRAEGACAGHRTFSFCGEFKNNNKTD